MTRKHFEAIAAAVRVVYTAKGGPPEHDECRRVTCVTVAEQIAKVLTADNPRFDRERFMRACQTDKPRRHPAGWDMVET